jgi:hypothetical protein
MTVAVWKSSQDETVANRQDHCKYEGEDAVLSSTATATFVERIRAKGHGHKGDEEKDDQWDAEEQMLSLRGGDYRRANQRSGRRLGGATLATVGAIGAERALCSAREKSWPSAAEHEQRR